VRQSNLYIVIYSAALTIVCGGLLALAAEGLKEKQQENIALEQKKNILATVMELKDGDNITDIYSKQVKAFVIDYSGNVKEGMKAEDVVVAAEYKKPSKERLLPVYEFSNEAGQVESVVMPVYGYGLWNNIWGFVSLGSDFNTIKGVKFSHASETPGLGARIDSDEIQSRYKDKAIFEGDQIASVTMMKGEGNDYSNDKHKVDGMSGATLTGKGVNNMLKDYFACYLNYLNKNKKQTGI
jgi:Na+-transporting NADH:ubiquinone oxidoreductase subunit C